MAPNPPVSMFSLVGHGLDVFKRFNDLPTYYHELVNQYGKVVRLIVGPPLAPLDNILVTTQPECLRHILKDNFDNYEKGADLTRWMNEIFGHGIFGVDGESWYRQRKTAANIFTADNLRDEVTRTMQQNCALLTKALCEASEGGTKPVNIQSFFLSFTMDTFVEVGFGVQSNSLDPAASDEWKEFGRSFDGLQVLCPSRMFRPTWPLQRFLSNLALRGWPVGFLCGTELTIAKMKNVVDSKLNTIIEQRMKAGALVRRDSIASGTGSQEPSTTASPVQSPSPKGSSGSSSPKRKKNMSKYDETKRLDLLELFLDVKPAYSKDMLRDVIKSLLVGGRDTTAISLTWAFFELARNPEIEQNA
jgi:cytochrome P450